MATTAASSSSAPPTVSLRRTSATRAVSDHEPRPKTVRVGNRVGGPVAWGSDMSVLPGIDDVVADQTSRRTSTYLRRRNAGGTFVAQCDESCPVSRLCRSALASLSPTIWTILPLRSYLVVIASRDATVEASHTWEADRSMTTRSGSSAYANWV